MFTFTIQPKLRSLRRQKPAGGWTRLFVILRLCEPNITKVFYFRLVGWLKACVPSPVDSTLSVSQLLHDRLPAARLRICRRDHLPRVRGNVVRTPECLRAGIPEFPVVLQCAVFMRGGLRSGGFGGRSREAASQNRSADTGVLLIQADGCFSACFCFQH